MTRFARRQVLISLALYPEVGYLAKRKDNWKSNDDYAMNRIFKCLEQDFFTVPDGTLVNPFLNSKDIMSGLPWDLLDGLSVAAGQIDAGVVSEIHVHPYVSVVTVLLSGELKIRMKDQDNAEKPYDLPLQLPASSGTLGFTSAAVLASPGTFFQLDNSEGSEPARVLYLTSPSYIFEPSESADAPPIYDDAITLGRDWEHLAAQNWNPRELHEPSRSYAARERAKLRLAARSRGGDAA